MSFLPPPFVALLFFAIVFLQTFHPILLSIFDLARGTVACSLLRGKRIGVEKGIRKT
jgi:hypothetical protein